MEDTVTIAACRGVEIRHRDRTLLGPVDLTIARGEFWGVVGPNGAGKSTLLRTIAGLERAAAGTVELSGDGDRRRVGFLFQHHDFEPELPFTVFDVVAFGRTGRQIFGPLRGADDRSAVHHALELLGLAGMQRRLYRELSGGERQKVQLARLLAQDAEVLLLDEPAAGLDLDWQERLTSLIEEVHDRSNVAVVMVTHEAHHLPSCCDRAMLLRQGRVIATGAPPEVFKPEILAELYGCQMEVTERQGRFFAQSVGPIE
jgi:ABC-type cobalamin/Fe3+-siderophores transport system ATPase subunit